MSSEAADGVARSSGPDGVGGCGRPRGLFRGWTKLGFGEEWWPRTKLREETDLERTGLGNGEGNRW
jgi:hypothetical protein